MQQTNFLKSRIFNSVVGMAGLLALSVSATLLAEVHESMKIKFNTEDGLNETVTIENLPVGSSDVFVTESGKEAFITRDENGLAIEIAGRTVDVKIPKFESLHEDGVLLHELNHEGGDHHGVKVMKLRKGDGDVHVITEDELADLHELHELDDEHVWVDEDGNAKSVIVKKSFVSDVDLSEEEIAELMADLEVDVEIDADSDISGAEHREIIIIKRAEEVEVPEDDQE